MTVSSEPPAQPAYATAPRPRRVKRVKLALFLSALAACLLVSLIGLIGVGIFDSALRVTGGGMSRAASQGGLSGGAVLATQLSAFNFILFFITVPAAALALGFSIARFPGRGITARKPYLRWGAIWGAVLVGLTTGIFGLMADMAAGFGAFITGGLIGALSGAVCGVLFHAIVRPARQLSQEDISVF